MASFQGVVTSYGMKKGYGFIQSEQIQGDVFFLRGSLPAELAGGFFPELSFQLKGTRVAFSVQRSQTGKSEAVNIKFVPVQGKPVVGEVKTYNEAKGYGFITSSCIDGQDILFSRKEVPAAFQGMDLKGEKCAFVVERKPDGKLQATNLKLKRRPGQGQLALMGGSNMMGMFGMGQFGKGFGKGSGKGFGKGGDRPEPGMQGTIVSYNAAKGYGFIKSGRGDVYFKAQGNFQPGMAVAFNLRQNRDGKLSAVDPKPGLASGQTCVGVVKAFNPDKGHGFLTVANHPADVYFHKDLVPAQLANSNLEGRQLRFTVALSADGKARAESLSA